MRTLPAVVLGSVLVVAGLSGCTHHTNRPAGQPAPSVSAGSAGASGSAGTASPGPDTPTPTAPPVPPKSTLKPPSLPPNVGTGITGITILTGGCPVATAEPNCPDRPISAPVSVLDVRTNKIAATTTSGVDGTFRIDIAPGRYLVQAPGPGPLSARAAPVPVEVVSGAFAPVTLRFQSHLD